jgi:hypothetical protein
MKAIVLLGYRNSGKDSVFKALDERISGLRNIKFGAFNKTLVAELLEVPVSWMEDKTWRNEPYFYGVTPLELIDALFVYSDTSEKFQQKIDETSLVEVGTGEVLVFTDIRRERELSAVYNKYGVNETCVCWIESGSSKSVEIGDRHLDKLQGESDLVVLSSYSFAEIADIIINFCNLSSQAKKPKLHIFDATNKVSPELRQLPVYEPLQPLIDRVQQSLKDLGLGIEVLPAMFNLVYSETPIGKLELAGITKDSVLNYVPKQHWSFIPQLRKKANLLYYIKKGVNPTYDELDIFEIEEIHYYA